MIKWKYVKTWINLICYQVFLQVLFDESPFNQLLNHKLQSHLWILTLSHFSPSFTNSIDFTASI